MPFLAWPVSGNASLDCAMEIARCIRTQGTELPLTHAMEISYWCEKFTYNDLGRVALRLTRDEILDRSGGRLTPLVMAMGAFSYLDESPIAFDRQERARDGKYEQIKRSCSQLDRDLNDKRKWTGW